MIIHRFLKHLIGIFIFAVAALMIFALVPGIDWLRTFAILIVGICASRCCATLLYRPPKEQL